MQLILFFLTAQSRILLSTSLNAHAFACNFNVVNYHDKSKTTVVKLHIDSLFTGELLLLQSTVDALGLNAIPGESKPLELGDKSIVQAVTYEDVLISVQFNDGSVKSAKVTPIVLTELSSIRLDLYCNPCCKRNAVVDLQKGEEVDEILGHSACEKLGVVYNFANHTLSKLVMRL